MCEECEDDQPLMQSYAQKRARVRAYWTPKRKPLGLTAMETGPSSVQLGGADMTNAGRTPWISDSKTKSP